MTQVSAKYPLTVMYVEVNDTNFLNTGNYTLKLAPHKPLIDIGIIFAANINYDNVTDRAVLYCNQNVTTVLKGFETYIRPLQDKGIKVLLSILGNHQGVGICNIRDVDSARDFAQQLAHAVTSYGLDGIDFDDEYAKYPNDIEDSSRGKACPANQLPPNRFSFIYLLRELRHLLPTKILSLYYYGPVVARLVYKNLAAGNYLNYCWNGEYGKFVVPHVRGLTIAQLGPAAVDVKVTRLKKGKRLARRTIKGGYGAFLLYRLPISDICNYLNPICEVLYGCKVKFYGKCWPWPPASEAPAVADEEQKGDKKKS